MFEIIDWVLVSLKNLVTISTRAEELQRLLLIFLLLPPLLSSLVDVEYESARRSGGTEVLIFYLVDLAKALAQFQYSSRALMLTLEASLEATEQFEQAMEVEEAFLVHCSRLRLDFLSSAFGHAGAAALPLNMVDVGLHQMVSSVAGDVMSLRAIPFRNL